MGKYCEKCKKVYQQEGVNFCEECGSKLVDLQSGNMDFNERNATPLDLNGQNNKSAWNHSGKKYVFISDSSITSNSTMLVEISPNGKRYEFHIKDKSHVSSIDADKAYLYFCDGCEINRISWESIKNRVPQIEIIEVSPGGISDISINGGYIYYILKKRLVRKNMHSGLIEEIGKEILCGNRLIKNSGYLYFCNNSVRKNEQLCRLNLLENTIEVVIDKEKIGKFAVYANKIIYKPVSFLDSEIRIYDIKSHRHITIIKDVFMCDVVGDRLYYEDFSYNFIEYSLLEKQIVDSFSVIYMKRALHVNLNGDIVGDFLYTTAKASLEVNYMINLNTGEGRFI